MNAYLVSTVGGASLAVIKQYVGEPNECLKSKDNNWLLLTGERDAQMRQWCGQKRFVWNCVLAMEQARTLVLLPTLWHVNPAGIGRATKVGVRQKPEHNFDRTLNQLERLQRMQKGQAVPAPISVSVSAS